MMRVKMPRLTSALMTLKVRVRFVTSTLRRACGAAQALAGWLSKCDDLCALTQCHEPCSLTHFQMLCAAHVANLPVRHAVIVNLPRQQGDFKRRRSPCCHRRHGKIHTLCPRMRARADARGCSTEAAVGPWRVRLTCLPMGSRIIVPAMTWIADFTTLARPSCAVTGGEACARAGGGGAGMPAGGRCHAFGVPTSRASRARHARRATADTRTNPVMRGRQLLARRAAWDISRASVGRREHSD
jgi:hypothetical protein